MSHDDDVEQLITRDMEHLGIPPKEEYHHWYCEECENKFAGSRQSCPNCGSNNVSIDDVITRRPIPPKTDA